MPLLSVGELTVRFGGVVAVDGVSFSVREKELLGVIGPNGAGKTTVMRALAGTVRPSGGEVRFAGTVINKLPVYQRVRLGIGLSQQIVKPFAGMTTLDNVAFAAGGRHTGSAFRALARVGRRAERRRALALLEQLDIGDYAADFPVRLPLGVLKRLELARALALDPKLLLLDEPLAGLNNVEAARIADTITGLARRGTTVILIEHNLGEVVRVCSRLVVIDNGVKIAEGAPGDVIADRAVRAAYLGT